MTLEELHAQLGELLRLHPEHSQDEANFILGSEITRPEEEDHPLGTDDPVIHSLSADPEIIDGLTKVYDSDADQTVWVFHS